MTSRLVNGQDSCLVVTSSSSSQPPNLSLLRRDALSPQTRLRCLRTVFPEFTGLTLEEAEAAVWWFVNSLPSCRDEVVEAYRTSTSDPGSEGPHPPGV